jgi:hypothetical protein
MKCSFYIDESYQAPETKRPPYFYLMSLVSLNADQLGSLQDYLLDLGGAGALHATDLARSPLGREIIESTLAFVVQSQLQVSVLYSQVIGSDRLAEAARRTQLLIAFKDAYGSIGAENTLEIFMDRRMPGYQVSTDERRVRSFRQSSVEYRNASIESVTSHEQPGIVLADFTVWAYRQQLTGRSNYFWNMLSPVARLREVK